MKSILNQLTKLTSFIHPALPAGINAVRRGVGAIFGNGDYTIAGKMPATNSLFVGG